MKLLEICNNGMWKHKSQIAGKERGEKGNISKISVI